MAAENTRVSGADKPNKAAVARRTDVQVRVLFDQDRHARSHELTIVRLSPNDEWTTETSLRQLNEMAHGQQHGPTPQAVCAGGNARMPWPQSRVPPKCIAGGHVSDSDVN
jgi:hypothetical protein